MLKKETNIDITWIVHLLRNDNIKTQIQCYSLVISLLEFLV